MESCEQLGDIPSIKNKRFFISEVTVATPMRIPDFDLVLETLKQSGLLGTHLFDANVRIDVCRNCGDPLIPTTGFRDPLLEPFARASRTLVRFVGDLVIGNSVNAPPGAMWATPGAISLLFVLRTVDEHARQFVDFGNLFQKFEYRNLEYPS